MIKSGACVASAAKALRGARTTSVDLTLACLRQLDAVQARTNAFIAVNAGGAIAQARASDSRRSRSSSMLGPLDGIPVAVKDNFCGVGGRTTAASATLASFTPPPDLAATVVRRLVDCGAVVMGTTNADEFAMGSATSFSHFEACGNPWSPPSAAACTAAASVTCYCGMRLRNRSSQSHPKSEVSLAEGTDTHTHEVTYARARAYVTSTAVSWHIPVPRHMCLRHDGFGVSSWGHDQP